MRPASATVFPRSMTGTVGAFLKVAVGDHLVYQMAPGCLMAGDELAGGHLGDSIAQVDRPFGQIVHRLADDLDALVDLQYPDDHPGIHVPGLLDGDGEVEVLIGGVGGVPAHVHVHPGGPGVGTPGARPCPPRRPGRGDPPRPDGWRPLG